MKLVRLRLCNFRSFGSDPTEIALNDNTFLLGPNGTGKTAVLQALARMFSLNPTQRKIRCSDFNVPIVELPDQAPETRELWLEADFEFPELALQGAGAEDFVSVPGNFAHMQLLTEYGPAQVRFRLKAAIDHENDIEESFTYVVSIDENDEPVEESRVPKQERNSIQIHYLPALRDPADHISFSANSLLGRALRAADWSQEREQVSTLTKLISDSLAGNSAIDSISEAVASQWGVMHKGEYFENPTVSFARNEIESLLRHLSVGFTPGHGEMLVDFSRLSDGEQSLLYISLVLAMQDIGRKVLSGELDTAFDVDKLRPAVFTLIAIEEPENSLSPHYLGRVVAALAEFSEHHDAQAVVATHSPSLLRRVRPESVRYLRLGDNRTTIVKCIELPDEDRSAYRFVREGVQAFPELYFSRLVVLGEGDSEEIVLSRMLEACGMLADDASISVVPLGGRHVNHFWRLLKGLGIPHVTLLDLDVARYQGGWGRIKYVAKQLLKYADFSEDDLTQIEVEEIHAWNGEQGILLNDDGWISKLERFGVFFSTPLDLDFMMMRAYPKAYRIKDDDLLEPDESSIVTVLGKRNDLADQYSSEEQNLFDAYHTKFQLGSKPTWHLGAMASIDNKDLLSSMPEVLMRMFEYIRSELEKLPE